MIHHLKYNQPSKSQKGLQGALFIAWIPDSYDTKIAKICIRACNSANKQSFQNPTKSLFAQCCIDVKSAVTFLKQHLWTEVKLEI